MLTLLRQIKHSHSTRQLLVQIMSSLRPEGAVTSGTSLSLPVPDAAVAQARFIRRNPRSLELHKQALRSLPGGNTRSLLYAHPFPLNMKSGKGYQVSVEDGHT
jgi:hypothetical protein